MFYFGVDYYPEQWPEERWPIDAQLMAEAGFNVVRLAEFAWAKMEPAEGKYDFDWLDRAIGILQEHGMKIVLGTPTASPPPWLMAGHPDLFRVRQDGVRITYGNRRGYCPSQPVYREHTRRIVETMAEHYAGHPAVIGWQVDNEFGEPCYCPVCTQAFHTWLRERYVTTEELNRKWGTNFWSHVYMDWSEIPVPSATGGSPNPGLALDFDRFASDAYVSYQQLQIDILRWKCPGHFITHNLMGFGFDYLNYFDLARSLDLVAWDNYPSTQWTLETPTDPGRAALSHATMRGLKGRNFWVLEQQAGLSGWEVLSPVPRPGELRLWAYQSIAHGADGIVFFRWRTSRFGTEQFWHGLLDHDGVPSRGYAEIKHMGDELKTAGEQIAGSTVKSPVAMILSYDSRFGFQIQPNNPDFQYEEHFYRIYRSFFRRHISVDIVPPTADISSYKVVLAPALYIVPPEVAVNLENYVRAGGILVVTQRSGVKDEYNTVFNQRLPGPLAELCGVEVEECDSLNHEMHNRLDFTSSEFGEERPEVGIFCEVLKPMGAQVLARYASDYYAGKPAITAHSFGAGRALYVGAVGGAQLYDTLSGWLLGAAGLQPVLDAPEGLEVAERWQGEQLLLFVLNHTGQEQTLDLGGRYLILLGAASVIQGRLVVGPREVLLLKEARKLVRQRG